MLTMLTKSIRNKKQLIIYSFKKRKEKKNRMLQLVVLSTPSLLCVSQTVQKVVKVEFKFVFFFRFKFFKINLNIEITFMPDL